VDKQNVGILHPGQMGVSIAASAKNSGHAVYWVSAGRSPQTRARAEEQGFLDAGSLAALCETCSVIVSVCPPDAAEDMANDVIACGFDGLYLDANAISPQRAVRIGQAMTRVGITFVDGSIIGGPAWKPDSTWLYLSGEEAQRAAACFSAGPLETEVVGDEIGKASALKMCFAGYTKGTTALLCATLAAAEALGVREDLARHWARNGSGFDEQAANSARTVTAKAWRFVGEMGEIADTLQEAGLPGEFHQAAADIYQRMADFKGAAEKPSLEEILSALLHKERQGDR
jgi:3-hydroxyisobutyrate dehydrogenase-like beta-hydroxyacid dehydrogenase